MMCTSKKKSQKVSQNYCGSHHGDRNTLEWSFAKIKKNKCHLWVTRKIVILLKEHHPTVVLMRRDDLVK